MTRPRRLVFAIALLFVVVAGWRIGVAGIPSEEALPHLFAHPRVAANLEGGRVTLRRPWSDPGGHEESGLVATDAWPTLAYVAPPRSYPVLTESWQAGYMSYVAAAVAPLLGGGIEGLRRSSMLVGALGILLAAALARRLDPRSPAAPVVTALLLATMGAYVFLHRIAYHIESAPVVAVVAATLLLHEKRHARVMLAALLAGIALALKITMLFALAGVALWVWQSPSLPRRTRREWTLAALACGAMLWPIALLYALGGVPNVVSSKVSLLASPLGAVGRLPAILATVFVFLGDAPTILGPVFEGAPRAAGHLWGATLPVAVTLWSLHRAWRRPDDRGAELLWLSVLASVAVCSAALYDHEAEFQSSFMLAPFYAIAAARMVVALARASGSTLRRASGRAAVALIVAAHALSALRIASVYKGGHNPMFAMRPQRELVASLLARGVYEPLTATYNEVGFYEFLSGGALRPVHLYTLFLPSAATSEPYEQAAERAWRAALRRWSGPVVLTASYNLFEGGDADVDVVRRAFHAACRKLGIEARVAAHFDADDGAPVFELIELDRSQAHLAPTAEDEPPAAPPQSDAFDETPASDETRAGLGGLAVGDTLGPLVVSALFEPRAGAVRIHVRAQRGTARFEVRLASPGVHAPASSGRYAVYYRLPDDPIPSEELVAGAQAIADALGRAGAHPLSGVTAIER